MKFFGGSRFWQNAFVFQVLSFALSAYVVRTAGTEQVALVAGPMFIMLGGVGATLFAGSAWVKKTERTPQSQAAFLERQRFEREQDGAA